MRAVTVRAHESVLQNACLYLQRFRFDKTVSLPSSGLVFMYQFRFQVTILFWKPDFVFTCKAFVLDKRLRLHRSHCFSLQSTMFTRTFPGQRSQQRQKLYYRYSKTHLKGIVIYHDSGRS